MINNFKLDPITKSYTRFLIILSILFYNLQWSKSHLIILSRLFNYYNMSYLLMHLMILNVFKLIIINHC